VVLTVALVNPAIFVLEATELDCSQFRDFGFKLFDVID